LPVKSVRSGTLDVTERPGLAALMDAAGNGRIDAVIIASLDRIGRQTRIVLGVAEWLASLKVEILSCRENLDTSTPSGQFVMTMFAALAQLEMDTIRERTMGGSVKSAQNGNVIIGGSMAPYGYDIGEVDGKRTLVINDAEADVVRLIFDKYSAGAISLLGICDYLTDRRIPLPAKGTNHQAIRMTDQWSKGTLSGILNNETYIGNWYYRKTRRVKQANGKYTTAGRPRSEWLLVEVPAIIDRETFESVKRRRIANKRQFHAQRRHTYALGGMLTCGRCDAGISGISRSYGDTIYRYYKCNAKHSHKRYGYKCDMPTAKPEAVDATVWEWVSGILLSPGRLREEWDRYRQNSLNEAQPLIDMIEANERKIDALRAEKRRLVRAYREGVLSLDDIAADKADIERLIDQYTQANEELAADVAGRTPGQVDFDAIEEFAAELALGAAKVAGDTEAQYVLYRLLQVEGALHYNDANKQHVVDVSCILGQQTLSVSSTTPPRSEIGPASARAASPGSPATVGAVER